MSQQLDLRFPSAAAPLQPTPEAELLVDYLLNHPGFHTARELSPILNLTDREIRKASEQSSGQIVSGPGSPGYCHLHHCPAEKLAHIADTLRSQARHMLSRSIRIRKAAHSIIR